MVYVSNNNDNNITKFKNITQIDTGNVDNMNFGGLIMG